MQIQTEVKTVRFIEFDGIRFYEDKRGYWFARIHGHPKRLHVYVWEKANGTVPKGFHIHHIDHDQTNNVLENLELIEAHEHLSLHGQFEHNKAKCRENLNKYARQKAAEYHKTETNRTWARENWKTSLGLLMHHKLPKVCEVCGSHFECSVMKPNAKYCSNSCKSKARRMSGIDNEYWTCIICGAAFLTNRYSKARTCCRKCTAVYWALKLNEGIAIEKNNSD